MSELKLVPCAKCGNIPKIQDKRIRFVVICECQTPYNYAIGDSVGFLDHIENEEAAQIAFDAVNVKNLKLTAIQAWNKEQEVFRLGAMAARHAARADELYEALENLLSKQHKYKPHCKRHGIAHYFISRHDFEAARRALRKANCNAPD